MKRLALLLTLALAACGGGATFPVDAGKAWVQPAPAPRPGKIIVQQGETVAVYNNVNPPRNTVGATLWGAYEKLPSPPTNAASAGGVLDITIDTASIPQNVATHGAGAIVLGSTFDPVPMTAGGMFHYSFEMRVPNAAGPGTAQVVAFYSFNDRTSKMGFWHGLIVFDRRCDRGETVKWDDHGGRDGKGTNRPIMSVRAPTFSCQPFGDWRRYSFAVNAEWLGRVIARLKGQYPALALSANPLDYELRHVNLNPEVHPVSRIDLSVRNWRLEVSTPGG